MGCWITSRSGWLLELLTELTILTQKKSDDGVIVDVDNGVDDVVDA